MILFSSLLIGCNGLSSSTESNKSSSSIKEGASKGSKPGDSSSDNEDESEDEAEGEDKYETKNRNEDPLSEDEDFFGGTENPTGGPKDDSKEAEAVATMVVYMDAETGSDKNDGSTPEKALKTLDKLNSKVLLPGSWVLFKSGQVFAGTLKASVDGTEEEPLVYSAYGDTKKGRPVISGNGAEFAVRIEGASNITLRNLEITNISPGGVTSCKGAVLIGNMLNDAMKNITVENCYIHDVNSTVNNMGQKPYERVYGGVSVLMFGGTKCRFENLNILNNSISKVFAGIYMNSFNYVFLNGWDAEVGFSNEINVKGNVITDVEGDGIVISNANKAMIENNIVRVHSKSYNAYVAGIWVHHVDGGDEFDVVVQNNESAYGRAYAADSQGFDLDNQANNCLLQNNYSHHNSGGFLLDMGSGGNNVVRYNVSFEDQRYFISQIGHYTRVYNNTFYSTSDNMYFVYYDWNGWVDTHARNNVVYMGGKRGKLGGMPKTTTNNCFYGVLGSPTSAGNFQLDPLFADPSLVGNGRDSVKGLALQAASPCIDAGAVIYAAPKTDFFGNPIQGTVDIGALEFQGTKSASVSKKAYVPDDYSPNSKYKIVNRLTNKALTVSGDGNIVVEEFTGSSNQAWLIQSTSGNSYRILSLKSQLCLTLREVDKANQEVYLSPFIAGDVSKNWVIFATRNGGLMLSSWNSPGFKPGIGPKASDPKLKVFSAYPGDVEPGRLEWDIVMFK